MIVNDGEMALLTKSTEKLTKTFSVIFSLAKIVGGEPKKEPRSFGFFEGIGGAQT